MKLPPQIDRSVSVSVAVVFRETTLTLSSGIVGGSPFSPGRTPTTDAEVEAQEETNGLTGSFANLC